MTTKVVHCRKRKYDVYIGRPSKWGNPFMIGKDGSRQAVIDKYEKHILSRPDLLADLHELRGKTLGCWCKPKLCHGDVLAKLADSLEVNGLGEMADYFLEQQMAGQMSCGRVKREPQKSTPEEDFKEVNVLGDWFFGKDCDSQTMLNGAFACKRDSKLYICCPESCPEKEEPIKKIVQVTFAGNNEVRYDFFTDLDLKPGEDVVCHTVRGFSVAKVVGFVKSSTKARDWIVQRVDVERYQALVERDRQARELEDMLG